MNDQKRPEEKINFGLDRALAMIGLFVLIAFVADWLGHQWTEREAVVFVLFGLVAALARYFD